VFPLTIVMTDMCAGYPNVANTILFPYDEDVSDSLCNTIGGEGDSFNCRIELTSNSTSITTNITANATYITLNLQDSMQCVMVNKGTNPIGSSMRILAEDIANFPRQKLLTMLERNKTSVNTSDDVLDNFHKPIRDDLFAAADRAGTTVQTLVNDMSDVVGCTGIRSVVASFDKSMCCDFMSAFYWSVGAWYLLAWTMCCMGIPSTLFGYKRFSTLLWGPKVKMDRLTKKKKVLGPAEGDPIDYDQEPWTDNPMTSMERESLDMDMDYPMGTEMEMEMAPLSLPIPVAPPLHPVGPHVAMAYPISGEMPNLPVATAYHMDDKQDDWKVPMGTMMRR